MDRKVKGYTILEILITIAILSILASFAFLWLRNLVLKQRLKATADGVMSALNTARIYSMTGREGRLWGVGFNGDNYILFKVNEDDSSNNSNCSLDLGEVVREFKAEPGVTISTSTNCDIIVFDKKGYPRKKNCGLGFCSVCANNPAVGTRKVVISRLGRIRYEVLPYTEECSF